MTFGLWCGKIGPRFSTQTQAGLYMLNWGRQNAQRLPVWKQSGPMLSAGGAHVGPMLSHLGLMLGASWAYVGPSRAMLSHRAILGLCWAKLGPCCVGPMLGLCWPMLGPLGSTLGPCLWSIVPARTRAAARWPAPRFKGLITPDSRATAKQRFLAYGAGRLGRDSPRKPREG